MSKALSGLLPCIFYMRLAEMLVQVVSKSVEPGLVRRMNKINNKFMIQDVVRRIRDDLVKNFADVDKWFDCDEALLDHVPPRGGWTIRQILEHVSLTNHFLLILIRKGTKKA